MNNLKCDLGEEELRRGALCAWVPADCCGPHSYACAVISCLTGKYQEVSVYLSWDRRNSCMFSEANKEVSAFRGQPRIFILTLGIQATK